MSRFFLSLISSFSPFPPDSFTLRSLFFRTFSLRSPSFTFYFFLFLLSVFKTVYLMRYFFSVLFSGFEDDGERMLTLTFCRLVWDADPLSCEVYGTVSAPNTMPHLVYNRKSNTDFRFRRPIVN